MESGRVAKSEDREIRRYDKGRLFSRRGLATDYQFIIDPDLNAKCQGCAQCMWLAHQLQTDIHRSSQHYTMLIKGIAGNGPEQSSLLRTSSCP